MASRAWRQGCQWQIAKADPAAADFARSIGTSPLVAQALINRGLGDSDAAKSFLSPKLTDLHDPQLLYGCVEAAGRIASAVKTGKKIVIYGDYDVDGMTGVAILHRCLKLAGADADFYVPHRLEEGYGVNSEAIDKLAAAGANMMITVDCGICACEPIARAIAAGIDVIVSDHHTPPQILPAASAIVHPRLGQDPYPNPHLSGAGVAFKLAWQVARETCGNTRVDSEMRDFLLDATCLAALGTIADVVPLIGENRSIAVHGLMGLPATNHPGLRALLESAKLTGQRLDAYHVGFLLAPRLNACGRMGHAQQAVELLTGAPNEKCREIADFLAQQNAQRQKVEREIAACAIEIIDSSASLRHKKAIVLADKSWHGGVIGIVASRLVEKFNKPAVLIAVNAVEGQGSCRSIPGFNMYEALSACSGHLRSFGGHAMAGGLRIDPERIEAFAAAFAEHAETYVGDNQLQPLHIDAEATLGQITYATAEHFSRMAPFGEGNPQPLLAFRSCRIISAPRRMGRNGGVLSLILGQGSATMRAVGFGMGELANDLAGVNQIDVAAGATLNRFNGATNVELKLSDVRWDY